MPRNAFQNIKKFILALLQLLHSPYPQVKFFFIARCADNTESISMETMEIASVVSVPLISAAFQGNAYHVDRCTAQGQN